ncbi:MAG: GNAT family N-acetyltransferase [Nitratireductor sp.]
MTNQSTHSMNDPAANISQSNPLFLDCPIIATERLVLRPPHIEDAEELTMLANNIKIARMLGTMPHPYTDKDAKAFIDKCEANIGRACIYVITEEATGKVVGVGGLHEDPTRYEEPYLGYWIGEPYWGQGYATEAARAMVDLFFKVTNSPALLVSARVDNVASKKIIGKCGGQFQNKSTVRHTILNENLELEHFKISRENWMGEVAA